MSILESLFNHILGVTYVYNESSNSNVFNQSSKTNVFNQSINLSLANDLCIVTRDASMYALGLLLAESRLN